MKKFIFCLLTVVGLYSNVVAGDQNDDVWVEDYGVPAVADTEAFKKARAYEWLYEKLIPEVIRVAFPDPAFKSFRVHLKDSDEVFPDPSQIAAAHLGQKKTISGLITYVGFFPKRYTYDVLTLASGRRLLSVRVHFQDGTAQDQIEFAAKVKSAEAIWNQARVSTDFDYAFHFEVVTDPRQAHFSVHVKDSTRGPYDTNWGRDWTPAVVAHELGHMMGLGDEYKTLSGDIDCLQESLMCTAWKGQLMRHHFYFILRRMLADSSLN